MTDTTPTFRGHPIPASWRGTAAETCVRAGHVNGVPLDTAPPQRTVTRLPWADDTPRRPDTLDRAIAAGYGIVVEYGER